MKLSEQEIYKIHQQQAIGEYKDLILDLVWTHSLIVKEISLLMIESLTKRDHDVIDQELVVEGALLHDIGAYICLEKYPIKGNPPYIQHGIIGAAILDELGFDQKITRFASHHTGVGVTEADINKQKLPLPLKNLVPITAEEEIVAYADNFHGKDPEFVTFDQARAEFAKFNPENGEVMDVWRRKYGVPDLTKIEEKYKSWHEKFLKLKSGL